MTTVRLGLVYKACSRDIVAVGRTIFCFCYSSQTERSQSTKKKKCISFDIAANSSARGRHYLMLSNKRHGADRRGVVVMHVSGF
jgi:hypothetical protein